MSPRERGEQEEGILSNSQNQRKRQEVEARIRRINTEDLQSLDRDMHFRRWFGRWAVPLLMMDLRTSSGSDLFHFMGRRSLVLEMINELDAEAPGFYERVMLARKNIENELRPQPQPEEE